MDMKNKMENAAEQYDFGSVKTVSEERLAEMQQEMLAKFAWMSIRC